MQNKDDNKENKYYYIIIIITFKKANFKTCDNQTIILECLNIFNVIM